VRSEKDQVEGEKQAAIKASEEKATILEEAKIRSEKEKVNFARDLGAKEEEAAQLKGRIRELEEGAEKSRVAISGFEDDKNRFEEERRNLEKDLACFEEEKLCLEKDLEERAAELAASKQERERLAGELKKNIEENEKNLNRIKDLETTTAQAELQNKEAREQCADLENKKEQIKAERDEKARILEQLTNTVREKEELFKKEMAGREELETKLEEEKKAHAKVQAHSRRLEATLLSLEKRIDELISPRSPKA
jgi:chromosome segregation ATPase